MSGPADEFVWIASLAPLTLGDPRALDLQDDVAILPSRRNHDLVISKDAMVAGVHFLPDESPGAIARRLLRTSLSDLAAKAAEPFGYLLLTAFPAGLDDEWRTAFCSGLAADGQEFGVALLGGDTVATPGPLTISATVLGWSPRGRAVLRSGAREGDTLVVCGTIGDAWLGLAALRGEMADPDGYLTERFRLPQPLLSLRAALRGHARACADISDGLIADAGHIARASRLAVVVDVDAMPLSPHARSWADSRDDRLVALATGGDDYALAVAIAPDSVDAFVALCAARGVSAARAGGFSAGSGATVRVGGHVVDLASTGFRHRL